MKDVFELKHDELINMSYEDFMAYCAKVWAVQTTLHWALANRVPETVDQQLDLTRTRVEFPHLTPRRVLVLLEEKDYDTIAIAAKQDIRENRLRACWKYVRAREFPAAAA